MSEIDKDTVSADRVDEITLLRRALAERDTKLFGLGLENAHLVEDKLELQEQVAKLKVEAQKAEAEIAELRAKAELRAVLAERDQAIAEREQRISALECYVDKLGGDNGVLSRENMALKAEVARLTEREQMHDELRQETHRAAVKTVGEVVDKINAKDKEIAQLRARLGESIDISLRQGGAIVPLEARLNEKCQACEDIERNMVEMTKRLAEAEKK